MRKIIVVLLCGLLLVSCSGKSDYKVSLLSPKGAPSISLLNCLDDITTVDGAEVLQASLINPNPAYDIIIAPINLGCKLIQNGKSKYLLAGVVTWGNLYIVGKKGAEFSDLISFGQGSVTEKVFNTIKDNIGYKDEVTYYASVSEVASLLISTEAKCGLVAEPVLSKILQANKNIEILFDVQEEYQKATGLTNYPQAALFVNAESYLEHAKEIDAVIKAIKDYLSENSSSAILLDLQNLNDSNKEVIGVNVASLSAESIERCNLKYQNALQAKDEIERFLKLFGIESIDDCLLKEN